MKAWRIVARGFPSLVTLVAPTALRAQSIPARTVTVEASTDSGMFKTISSVRPLPDSRVMVNDPQMRRLIALNPDFKSFTSLADTASGAPNPYTAAFVGLVKFAGDSSLFVDQQAGALIVIDPHGKFGRVMAAPKASDLSRLLVTFCTCGADPTGRLVYRGSFPLVPVARPPANYMEPVITPQPDSAPIVRADFSTRTVDTVAVLKLPVQKQARIPVGEGRFLVTLVVNPLPVTDEWALLPDGTIAIVRGSDYHMDWISPDGTKTSSPKMPFDWKRITEEEKIALIDSLRKAFEARQAAIVPQPSTIPLVRQPFMAVQPSEMGDYYPAVRQGQVRADPSGNVWILPGTSSLSTATQTGLVWDVVNRKGEIAERVQLPPGRNLAAIGSNGLLFLIYAPAPGKVLFERARINR